MSEQLQLGAACDVDIKSNRHFGICTRAQEHHFEDPSSIMDVYETGQGMSYGSLFKKMGFKRPILFKNPSGLEMKLPSSKAFDIDSVAALVGTRSKLVEPHVHCFLMYSLFSLL